MDITGDDDPKLKIKNVTWATGLLLYIPKKDISVKFNINLPCTGTVYYTQAVYQIVYD